MRRAASGQSSERKWNICTLLCSRSRIPAATSTPRCLEVDLKESFIASAMSPTVASFSDRTYFSIANRRRFASAFSTFSSSFSFMAILWLYFIYSTIRTNKTIDTWELLHVGDERAPGKLFCAESLAGVRVEILAEAGLRQEFPRCVPHRARFFCATVIQKAAIEKPVCRHPHRPAPKAPRVEGRFIQRDRRQ